MKHKHYDCIVAYANGEKIQYLDEDDEEWVDIENPSFIEDYQYRIKKEPVIEVKYFEYIGEFKYLKVIPHVTAWDLKITYQDGKAIKAELPE